METFYLKNDRGVSTSVKQNLLPQRIVELEDGDVDALWVSFNINSRATLLGNFYTNANSTTNNIHATLLNIDKAKKYATTHKFKHILILGDFNCRHEKWADTLTNKNGAILDKYVTNNDLIGLSPNTYTFKQMNGGSVIDLAFVTPDMSRIYNENKIIYHIQPRKLT